MLTCIRNQGQRGTCHVFAAISAIEELIARDTGTYVNLSEQDFMENSKLVWASDYYTTTAMVAATYIKPSPPDTNSLSRTPGTTIRRPGQPQSSEQRVHQDLRRLPLD